MQVVQDTTRNSTGSQTARESVAPLCCVHFAHQGVLFLTPAIHKNEVMDPLTHAELDVHAGVAIGDALHQQNGHTSE